MWDRKQVKATGKAAFKANYWRTVLVCVLLSFFVLGGSASVGGARRSLNITHVYNTPSVQSSQSGEITVNGTSYGSVTDALEALDDLDFDDLELDELVAASSARGGEGIHYRVPRTATARVMDGGQMLLQTRIPVYQLGETLTFPLK